MFELLHHQDNIFRFDLESLEDQGNRFTVVIGPNGTGKSQLLRSIAEIHRLDESRSKAVIPDSDPHTQSKNRMSRLLVLSNMVTDVFTNTAKREAHYRYLGLRQASNNTSTGALRDATSASILECFNLPDGLDRLKPVMKALGGDRFNVQFKRNASRHKTRADETAIVEGFLANLERDYERSHYTSPGALLSELRRFEESAPREDMLLEFDAPEIEDFWGILTRFQLEPLDAMRLQRRLRFAEARVHARLGGRFVEIEKLSTGQLLLLSTFARLAGHIAPNTLVVIDEPEAGLHPNWQSEWIPLMRETIPADFGCHFIIATHSPYLVSDADDVLIPDEEWGAFVEFGEPYKGRSVENILYRVFGARVSGNLMVENDLRILVQLISGDASGSETHQPHSSDDLSGVEDEGELREQALDALERLRLMQGRDTANLNLIVHQASEVLGL